MFDKKMTSRVSYRFNFFKFKNTITESLENIGNSNVQSFHFNTIFNIIKDPYPYFYIHFFFF